MRPTSAPRLQKVLGRGPAPRTRPPSSAWAGSLGLWGRQRGTKEGAYWREGGEANVRGAQAVSWGRGGGGGRGSLNESHRQQVPAGRGQAWGLALLSFVTPWAYSTTLDNIGPCQTGLHSQTAARLREGLQVPPSGLCPPCCVTTLLCQRWAGSARTVACMTGWPLRWPAWQGRGGGWGCQVDPKAPGVCFPLEAPPCVPGWRQGSDLRA